MNKVQIDKDFRCKVCLEPLERFVEYNSVEDIFYITEACPACLDRKIEYRESLLCEDCDRIDPDDCWEIINDSKVFVVLINNRCFDTDTKVFLNEKEAIDYAKNFCKENMEGMIVEKYNTKGLFYFCRYNANGDFVSVKECVVE